MEGCMWSKIDFQVLNFFPKVTDKKCRIFLTKITVIKNKFVNLSEIKIPIG